MRPDFKQTFVSVGFIVVALAVLSLIFASAVVVAAVAAPLVALFFAWGHLRLAVVLWQSQGRLLLPDGAVRIIEPERARGLALASVLSALGTLALGLLLPAAIFVSGASILPLGLIAFLSFWAGRQLRQKLMREASPVDVLPPA